MSMSSMQLCLVNNDPTATLLVTPDGIPLFSVETPSVPYTHLTAVGGEARPKGPTTKIKRLERFHMSTGHVETEVGVVSYNGPNKSTQLRLSEGENRLLEVPPRKHLIDFKAEKDDEDDHDSPNENSWEFSGPDSKRYKWQMFAHSPVLHTADNMMIPLARFRRAKIGIVSRSRRAFLEILPAGINLIDLIVVTFVAFMKQRVMIEEASHPTDTSSKTTPPMTPLLSASPAPPPPPPPTPTPLATFLSSSSRITPDKLHLKMTTPSVASKS